VLDEFVSHLTGKARDAERKVRKNDYSCILAGENLIQNSRITLLQVDEGTIAEAKVLYNRYWEHGLDLTDWTSAVLMRKNGIGRILTFDEGFGRLKAIPEYGKISLVH
jgi:predicted nucleic acid-binding protein